MTNNILTNEKIKQLHQLVNEAKNTSCYKVANYATAVLLAQPDKVVSWERKKDKIDDFDSSKWKQDFHKDLVVVTVQGYNVCIPVTHLKMDVAKTAHNIVVKSKNVVPKLQHRRKKKPCLPGQYEYLVDKLTSIVPNWRQYVNQTLNKELVA